MNKLRILFRRLYKRNREGKDSSVAFSILNISVSDDDSKVIMSSLTSGFCVPIDSYRIESYSNEEPSILYTDLPLYLIEEDSNLYLTTSKS